MTIQLGTFAVHTRFIVVQNLAVPCILGTAYTGRYVRAIRCIDRTVELLDGSTVSIRAVHGKDEARDLPPARDPGQACRASSKIRVAKSQRIDASAEAEVWVQTGVGGLSFLQNIPGPRLDRGILMANVVADPVPQQPFRVRVMNLSRVPRYLPKGMVLGHVLPHTTLIVKLIDEGEASRDEVVETKDALADRPDESEEQSADWRDEVDLSHLYPRSRKEVLDLLGRHARMWDGRLGTIRAMSHRIELKPGARPVHSQPYRAGKRARSEECAEVERMLKLGIIEPSCPEWASPVVLVPKNDGSLRFCVDYRRLNTLTARDSYPLPRMDECIDTLGDAVVFTTLDCNSGYWQVPVDTRDRDKTSFNSHHATYRFTRLPFGLRNAPATFQRAVDIILARIKWQTCLVYVDDVTVFSYSVEKHFTHLDEALTLLGQAGVSLKLRKCQFFSKSVDYLGHVIRPGRLALAEKNTHALREAKHPSRQTEIRSFLGLCNVYRRFVPGFARIAAPLNKLLTKGAPFEIDTLRPEEANAFADLRDRLLKQPILALPRKEGCYILDTDASDLQLGCCLSQEQPAGDMLPVGYWSRSLTSAERNYSTTEKECLAVVWAVLLFRPYLEEAPFTIRTDPHSLRWVLARSRTESHGRLERWRLRLQEFDYDVVYKPGQARHAADTMSRLPKDAEDTDPIDDSIPTLEVGEAVCAIRESADPRPLTRQEALTQDAQLSPISLEEFVREQAMDDLCQELRARDDGRDDTNPAGLLVRISPLDGRRQIVVPNVAAQHVVRRKGATHLTQVRLYVGKKRRGLVKRRPRTTHYGASRRRRERCEADTLRRTH